MKYVRNTQRLEDFNIVEGKRGFFLIQYYFINWKGVSNLSSLTFLS